MAFCSLRALCFFLLALPLAQTPPPVTPSSDLVVENETTGTQMVTETTATPTDTLTATPDATPDPILPSPSIAPSNAPSDSPSPSSLPPPSTKPHIVVVIADDLGWANVGYNAHPDAHVHTPTIDRLASEGIKLTRHYAYCLCSPSRTSFQTGRLPIHVNTDNVDSMRPTAGIPSNMTCIAEKLRSGGYATHFVGKWDAGAATPIHVPAIGRGYDTSLHYWGHGNNYFNYTGDAKNHIIDLWDTDAPAYAQYARRPYYIEYLFRDRFQFILENHPVDTPLFLVYAAHVAHKPSEVPDDVLAPIQSEIGTDDSSVCNKPHEINPRRGPLRRGTCRARYTAQVKVLDDNIQQLVATLQERDMWNNTLLVFFSDNGGPADQTANNYPLRGGKYSFFEGGVRVVAFVSGGYLPPQVRGTNQSGLSHIADWYTTFAYLANVSKFDYRARQSKLPPVDGVNLWPLLSGTTTTSPRTELLLGPNAYIQGRYKLLLSLQFGNYWTSPLSPNSSFHQDLLLSPPLDCNGVAGGACLYDVVQDPSEYHNLARRKENTVLRMKERYEILKRTFFSNSDPGGVAYNSSRPLVVWKTLYHGFWGPYQNLDSKFIRLIQNN